MDNDVRKLIQFLAEDCGWPIDEDQIDRSAWPVNNAELGLNDEVAVDSVEIYELRPLTTNQPWGVFFLAVKGTSKLSITLLRKLLRGLVKKKRASADTSNLQQWNLEDLMFVCSLDEPENTTRYFAHFKEQEKGLPKLMIGARWEDSQPENEIKAAKLKIKSNLRWPDNDNDIGSWRDLWSKAFPIGHKEVITKSLQLSRKLASISRKIKNTIHEIYEIENEDGPIHILHKSFQHTLSQDQNLEQFADMIAQTIAYGLFSARVTGVKLRGIETLVASIPPSNPFLRNLFQELSNLAGKEPANLDFDDLYIGELVDMLNSTNVKAIVEDFDSQFKGGKEDPVIHFYESFLNDYNKKLKAKRGVFYTPKPAVTYIIKSIDDLLTTKFGLDDGIADTITWGNLVSREGFSQIEIPSGVSKDDPFIQILDPAVGTGTFIVELIYFIHNKMIGKWKDCGENKSQIQILWNDYVQHHLLPRIFGYELLMAPYAIAHLKISLALNRTGYHLNKHQRVNIFLTNTIDSPSELENWVPNFLAKEAKEVNNIKQNQKFTVVIGNPPYSNYSANLSANARKVVDKYRKFQGVKIKERNQLQFERNLQDDYIKFISISQDIIQKSNVGIIGFITNGTMLASNSLRGMRESILNCFDDIYEYNLHGGTNEIISYPGGDENIFEISQVVAIHLYSRRSGDGSTNIYYSGLYGKREHKYAILTSNSLTTTDWGVVVPDAENLRFGLQDDSTNENLYRLDSAFEQYGAGIKTNRDSIAIGFEKLELLNSVKQFMPNQLVENNYDEYVNSILYRPFDKRLICYHKDVVASRSFPTMKHMINGGNLGIICCSTWTNPEKFSVNVSDLMIEMKTGTHDRGTSFFPIYQYTEKEGNTVRKHNFDSRFIQAWCDITKTEFLPVGEGDCKLTTGPEDIFHWLYGIFHSPGYRQRYQVTLSQGFPILQFTNNNNLLLSLTTIGKKLRNFHLMVSDFSSDSIATTVGKGDFQVEKVSYSKNTIWIDKDKTRGFSNVKQEVWDFYIGGYQVCEKWLKDRQQKGGKNPRQGLILSDIDISHYRNIVSIVSETINSMNKIEEEIKQHGGWPLVGSNEFIIEKNITTQPNILDF